MVSCKYFLFALKIYWRAIFSILWPIILSPILIIDYSEHKRCLYVVLLMSGYWITEAIHIAITSMLPIVLFPAFNLMDTDVVCRSYMKDANMMFLAGLIMAIAVEYSHLHERIAMNVIKLIGCSPKRLHFAMILITAFVSMWIANTAAAAIMLPIIRTILAELETGGIGTVYEPIEGEVTPEQFDEIKKPTRSTMCYYISAAYASAFGGLATLIGTGTNLSFKGIYESKFPRGPGIDFGEFMLISTPIAILILLLSTLMLQIWYLGLFRAKSKDAQSVNIGPEGEAIAKSVIIKKLDEMGSMTFHEIAVLLLFILAIILWILRDPPSFPGWAKLVTDVKVRDGTVGVIIVLLIFCIPAKPNFCRMFGEDEEKKPKSSSTGLVTWKYVHRKLPWGLIFLIGSGFAIADCAEVSGMNNYIVSLLVGLEDFPPYAVMVIGCLLAGLLTQLTSNVAIANITLPIVGDLARTLKIHPLYLMYPVALSCSFAYMLPVATPPNAIAQSSCNMPTLNMLTIGFLILIISWLVLFATAPFLGGLIWNYNEYPEWANVTVLS